MSLRPFRLSGDPAVEIANISDRLLVRINSMNPLADGAEDGERRNPGAPEDLGPNRREAISRWLRTSSSSSASRFFRHQNLTGHVCIFLPGHLCSGFSTPAMASESCDHFERCLVSCFFPAAVSW